MSHVSLVATRAFTYGGRALKPGDSFTAPRMEARVLKGIKKAVDASQGGTYRTKQEPAPLVGTLHQAVSQTAGEIAREGTSATGVTETARYDGALVSDVETDAAPPKTPTPRRHRRPRAPGTYRRRDLVPESDPGTSE